MTPNDAAMIAVVDRDEASVTSLRPMLQSIGYTVIAARNAASFLQQPDAQRAACIVSEFLLPDMGGITWLEALRRQGLMAPVIFVTHVSDVRAGVQAIKQGAYDFFPKPPSSHELIDAVRGAVRVDRHRRERQTAYDEHVARRRLLTPRERQVLDLIRTGAANAGVAKELRISARTVETHRRRVMTKLQVRSVVDLVEREMTIETLRRCPHCHALL